MKPRKPRVLWAVCFPAVVDVVSVCRKEVVKHLEDCRASGMKGGRLVRFVEAPRRKAKARKAGRKK